MRRYHMLITKLDAKRNSCLVTSNKNHTHLYSSLHLARCAPRLCNIHPGWRNHFCSNHSPFDKILPVALLLTLYLKFPPLPIASHFTISTSQSGSSRNWSFSTASSPTLNFGSGFCGCLLYVENARPSSEFASGTYGFISGSWGSNFDKEGCDLFC